ncbi:MAG: hypothetical protein IJ811_03640 [Clostridia bacterium]|nr:hypothetical protein [Clostridia bacterium]
MKKLTKQSVIFIATFAFTFLLFGGLIIWAALGAKAGEIRIVECQTQLAEDYRRNYLVGETLPTKGVSLVVDGVAE